MIHHPRRALSHPLDESQRTNCLQDVDGLIDKIFEVASISLMFSCAGLSQSALQFLRDRNKSRWGTL